MNPIKIVINTIDRFQLWFSVRHLKLANWLGDKLSSRQERRMNESKLKEDDLWCRPELNAEDVPRQPGPVGI